MSVHLCEYLTLTADMDSAELRLQEYEDLVEMLLWCGAIVTEQNVEGNTALHIAAAAESNA